MTCWGHLHLLFLLNILVLLFLSLLLLVLDKPPHLTIRFLCVFVSDICQSHPIWKQILRRQCCLLGFLFLEHISWVSLAIFPCAGRPDDQSGANEEENGSRPGWTHHHRNNQGTLHFYSKKIKQIQSVRFTNKKDSQVNKWWSLCLNWGNTLKGHIIGEGTSWTRRKRELCWDFLWRGVSGGGQQCGEASCWWGWCCFCWYTRRGIGQARLNWSLNAMCLNKQDNLKLM